ncbi:MAG: hypothetical protein HUJ22_13810 [Gracilimonas sp.]|uniref:DUF5683 domain-containing protein n=1 Tax=Gracilimonas sp. TaxID=1974203 RepID=UPI0019B83C63|nr:DUF5683 domain-containing protein [Gracilimonas sp.]MBD3617629.1 hypothetical protein [Gracilimonas sp.]
MKKFIAIGWVSFFLPLAAFGQSINTFSNGIFKKAESPQTVQKNVRLSDFRYQNPSSAKLSFLEAPRNNPGIAFAASAIVPGAGQAANGKWVRTGIYFTAEVLGIIFHLDRNAQAQRQERAYKQFAQENWSVVAYSKWLVNYSQQHQLNNGWQTLQNEISGENPNWNNTKQDWDLVSISTLRNVERLTPFYFKDRVGSNFSHELPDYGSQQYYELISKYYQFQPGWRDWYEDITMAQVQDESLYRYFWNGQDEPFELFHEGRDRAQEFNQNYRVAGNILKLILVNHVVSAFDALFTVQLKKSRIQTETNLLKMEQFSVTWHF